MNNKIFLVLLIAAPLFGATVFEECRWATGTGTTNAGATGEGVWDAHEHSAQGYITKDASSQGWYLHTQSLQINGSPQLTEDVTVAFSPYRDTLGVRLSFKVVSEDFGNNTESNFLTIHGSDGNNGASAFLYQDGSGVLRIRIKGVDGAAAEQVIGQTDAISTGTTYQLELLKRRNRTGGASAKLYDSAGTLIGSEIIDAGVTSEDDRCDAVKLGSNDDWKGARNMIFDIVQMDDAGYVGPKAGGSPPTDSFTITITEDPAAAFEYSLHPAKQETGLPDSLIFTVNSGYVCDGITGDTTTGTVATGTDTIIWPAISGNKAVNLNGHAWPEPTMAYNSNGGTGTMTDESSPYDSGATVTVLSNTFTRSGYVFIKWNTAANGSGTDRNPAATFTIVANTTLYAQWEAAPDPITDIVIHRPDTAYVDTLTLIDAALGTKYGGATITGKTVSLVTFDTTNFDTGSIAGTKLTRLADSTWRLNTSPDDVIKMKHSNFTILITGDEIDPFQISGTIVGDTLIYDTVAAGGADSIHWTQCATDSVIIYRQTASIEGSWTVIDTAYAHNIGENEGSYNWTNPFTEVTHDVFIRVLDYDLGLIGYKNYEITEGGAPPDSFNMTISITGNHLTEPDIDTTPFSATGRYETGTEITITADQAAMHKLVPSATFPESPLVFTITRDTTIIIQSDTFPKYTVAYNANGGSGTMTDASSPYDSNSAVTVLSNSFTRTNYHFMSFNTAANGSGTGYDPTDQFNIAATTVLYAIWGIDTVYCDTSYSGGATLVFLSAPDSIFAVTDPCSVEVTFPAGYRGSWTGAAEIGSPTAEVKDTIVYNPIATNRSVTAAAVAWTQYTRDTVIHCTATGCGTVTVSPAALTVDSSVACTTWADPATMDRCDSIVSVGSVSGRSVTTADSVIHIANQDWIDSVFFDTIPAVQYALTMTTTGTGTASPSGTTAHDSAAGFAITATPGPGYTFTGWTTVSGTILFNADSSRCSLSTAATVRANFVPDTTYLVVDIVPAGLAIVDIRPDTVLAFGPCTAIVTAATGAYFRGYHGADTAGTYRNGDTIIYSSLDESKHDTAAFVLSPVPVAGAPSAGNRVMMSHENYNSAVQYSLRLPADYQPTGTSWPVIVELPGNGFYANGWGDITAPGRAPNIGWGVGGDSGYVWVVLPWVNTAGNGMCQDGWNGCTQEMNTVPATTIAFAKLVLDSIIHNLNVDTNRINMTGFSRGGLGVGVVALADDDIAAYWSSFFFCSFIDAGTLYGTPVDSARKRLNRIHGRQTYLTIGALEGSGFDTIVRQGERLLREVGVPYVKDTIPGFDHFNDWTIGTTDEAEALRSWMDGIATPYRRWGSESTVQRKITFSPADTSGKFPVYINMADIDSSAWAVCQGRQNWRVQDSNGVALPFYIDPNGFSIPAQTGTMRLSLPMSEDSTRIILSTGGTIDTLNHGDSVQGEYRMWGFHEVDNYYSLRTINFDNPSAATVAYSRAGNIGKQAYCDSSYSTINFGDQTYFNEASAFSIHSIMTIENVNKAEQWILLKARAVNEDDVYFVGIEGTFIFNIGNGTTCARGKFTATDAGISNGVPFELSVVYDGSKSTNATRLEIYVNRVKLSLTFDCAAIPASTYDLSGYDLKYNYYAAYQQKSSGYLDEFWIVNSADHEKRTVTIQKALNHNAEPFYIESDQQYLVTGTDVGNGTHGFIPANDSVAESGGTVSIYAVYSDSVVFNGFSGDTAGMVLSGDTATFTMSADRAVTLTFAAIPLIDSICPNPQWRSDSASIYGARFLSAGVLRNITTVPPEDAIQKDWAPTKIDYYIPPTWPRGWNRLVVTNSDSLRDTMSQYIAIIRKAN